MRTYFPDDPAKQEMLDILIKNYKDVKVLNKAIPHLGLQIHPYTKMESETRDIIEKSTGEKIEEVLK